MYRVTQKALEQIHSCGEVALDYIDNFEKNGTRTSATRSGVPLEITTLDGFVCLHLAGECPLEKICPRSQCQKLR
jgi:hypothetical protein